MRWGLLTLLCVLASCATPPHTIEEQAAHYGPVREAPTAEALNATTTIDNIVWLSLPDREDYLYAWPRDAWAAEAEATVGLDCLIDADGKVACAADDDGWPQFNFEEAARRVSTRFRVATTNRLGVPTVGHRLKINVRFQFAN